jgi:hypothetical protein
LVAAFDRVDDAREDLERKGPTREAPREYYDANRGVVDALNGYMDYLDDEYGHVRSPRERRMNDLSPFEEWVFQVLGSPNRRRYGEFGRCQATAKTTGERCWQPATGTHGKCHYHGGAPGAGAPEWNQNATAEAD